MTQKKVLVTGGRFPAASALVSILRDGGARVDASDSYRMAPALHAHQVSKIHVVPGPVDGVEAYINAIIDIVDQREIDLIVPAYEEGFYLSRYRDLLPVPLFAPAFEAVSKLHDKARFVSLCSELGLPTPRTRVVTSQDALRDAITEFDDYVARPAYSRGGAVYLTNHGPRAGERSIEDCTPTAENPWLVQDYIHGRDVCSSSIVRDGKVLVHGAYGLSMASPSGWSVQFESVDDFGALEVTKTIAERFGYTGFIGFDYRLTDDGFVMIECNPRSEAGVFLMPRDWAAAAVLDNPDDLRIVPTGIRRQYSADLITRSVTGLPLKDRLKALISTPDAFAAEHELLPALLRYTAGQHWVPIAEREQVGVDIAFLEDMSWNGEPMPPISSGG